MNDDFRDFLAALDAAGVRYLVVGVCAPATVVQFGLPPRRIDVLADVTGLRFAEAWADRAIRRMGELEVPFLGLDSLLANKRATARPKDEADLAALRRRDA